MKIFFPNFSIFYKGWEAFIKVCAELADKTVGKIKKFESNRNSRTTEFFVLDYSKYMRGHVLIFVV